MTPMASLTNAAAANAMVLQAAKNQLPDKAKKDKHVNEARFAHMMEDHTDVHPIVESTKNQAAGQFGKSINGTLIKRKLNRKPDQFVQQQMLFTMEPGPMQLLIDHMEYDSTVPKYIDIDA